MNPWHSTCAAPEISIVYDLWFQLFLSPRPNHF